MSSPLFGDSFERPLGGYYIAVSQTLRHGLPAVVHSYLSTGRMVNLFPVTPESVSAVVYVGASAGSPPHDRPLAMRDYLLATCAGFPDEVLRVLAAMNANDFVFSDAIAQVEMPRITQWPGGRPRQCGFGMGVRREVGRMGGVGRVSGGGGPELMTGGAGVAGDFGDL